jgi:hypothetical protein
VDDAMVNNQAVVDVVDHSQNLVVEQQRQTQLFSKSEGDELRRRMDKMEEMLLEIRENTRKQTAAASVCTNSHKTSTELMR